MRATEVKTELDMVSRWATAALSDTIASLGTLTPGAMTTKIPCLALTKAAEALEALEGALPHINEADTQKIKTRLKVALSELEETWTVAVCNSPAQRAALLHQVSCLTRTPSRNSGLSLGEPID